MGNPGLASRSNFIISVAEFQASTTFMYQRNCLSSYTILSRGRQLLSTWFYLQLREQEFQHVPIPLRWAGLLEAALDVDLVRSWTVLTTLRAYTDFISPLSLYTPSIEHLHGRCYTFAGGYSHKYWIALHSIISLPTVVHDTPFVCYFGSDDV